MDSRSPHGKIGQIVEPLLICQGADDPRVKQCEGGQVVATMPNADNPVEYMVYPDEGRGFQRPENRLHVFAVAAPTGGRRTGPHRADEA